MEGLTTYTKIRTDEYERLLEVERNHRYLLSGELSYSNSVKNNNKQLQDKLDKIKEILLINKRCELLVGGVKKNNTDLMLQIIEGNEQ